MANPATILVDPPTQDKPADSAAPATQTPGTPQPAAPPAAASPPDTPDIPEKYRGKSPAQLIEMLEHSQSTIGRQSNEIGTYRQLMDKLLEANRARQLGTDVPGAPDSPPASAKGRPAVTADALLERPAETIAEVLRAELERELAPVKQTLAQRTEMDELEKLEADFPKFGDTVQTQEFREWVAKSRLRSQDAQAAAKGDVIAARRLLETWTEISAVSRPSSQEPKPTPASAGVAAARAASTEAPGNGSGPAKPVIYKDDVVKLMLRDPDKYKSASYQAELRAAIKEGRLK